MISPNSTQKTSLSMWASIDIFLTKTLLIALRKLANLCLLALGLATCISLRSDIFEYNESIGDLSTLEFFVLIALYFLARRHAYYARRLGMGFWSGLAKLLHGMGSFALCLLAVTGLVAALDFYSTGNIFDLSNAYVVDDPVMKFSAYAIFLFGFYLSVPTGTESASTIPTVVATANQEPS